MWVPCPQHREMTRGRLPVPATFSSVGRLLLCVSVSSCVKWVVAELSGGLLEAVPSTVGELATSSPAVRLACGLHVCHQMCPSKLEQ